MWIFTKFGFFSATVSPQSTTPDDPLMQIRARRREHLVALARHMGVPPCFDPEILETPRADYRYRMFMPRSQFSGVMAALVEEIDYSNFKDAASAEVGAKEVASPGLLFTNALHRVWSVMANLQPGGPYGQWDNTTKKKPGRSRKLFDDWEKN